MVRNETKPCTEEGVLQCCKRSLTGLCLPEMGLNFYLGRVDRVINRDHHIWKNTVKLPNKSQTLVLRTRDYTLTAHSSLEQSRE